MKEEDFEPVDLGYFFPDEDKQKKRQDAFDTDIVVFTAKQQKLVDTLNEMLANSKDAGAAHIDHMEYFRKRVENLKSLAAAIAEFPSLLERTEIANRERTPQSLIESLVNSTREGDTTLQLPSKATLGKGFLVAKLHTFSNLVKLAREAKLGDEIINDIHAETTSMMFLLLAEDVYLNLIRDTSLSMDARRQLASALLLLWEHRADQNIDDIAPVLQAVWIARAKLAPAFGTMMGTSELFTITFSLDDQWSKFIGSRLQDEDVKMAMEEFLFGISYEQILKLKSILREKGIAAIGRQEVSYYLGESVMTELSQDYRDFFQQYSIRRDNARVRNRLKIPGPHKTLEDHFISFVMQLNIEKQKQDAAAQDDN